VSFGPYWAPKAASAALTRTWAAELAPRGVRINAVVLGPTETRRLAELAPGNPNALLEQMASGMPFGQLLHPEEVAATVLFFGLASTPCTTSSRTPAPHSSGSRGYRTSSATPPR
jgi:NAD(P)-dependent dehydrogenase (short-subunit alcohol dehydrogenase family)